MIVRKRKLQRLGARKKQALGSMTARENRDGPAPRFQRFQQRQAGGHVAGATGLRRTP